MRYIVRGQRVGETKTQLAKELRREMTPAERILWGRLRGNRLGYHFRRQQVIEGYIADFYCHVAALVVEVDGPVHDYQADYDERRTTAFALRGIHVMRFRNNAVVTDTESVVLSITAACAERGAEPNPPAPFPKKEGGAEQKNEDQIPSSVLSPSPLRGVVGEGFQPQPNPLAPFPKKEGGADPEAEGFTPSSAPVLSPSPLRGGVGEGLL